MKLFAKRRARAESEMDAEMRAHIEMRAEHLIAAGVAPEEALRRARMEFGPIGHAKEACRDARGANLIPSLAQDLRFGLRMLRKSPGFAALAVVTLALGIGATTAVFSLVNSVLLRALPYRNPERLVYLFAPAGHLEGIPLYAWTPMNADFYDWQRESTSFAHLAMFDNNSSNLSVNGNAVRVNSARVTGDFFATLGIGPQIGRTIGPDDDRHGFEHVVVISHALWQAVFASDPHVLGQELLLNAEPHRVIGVMPPGFAFPRGSESFDAQDPTSTTDLWVPYALTPEERASYDEGSGNPIGLLKPGVSVAHAEAEISAILARDDKLRPEFFRGAKAVIRPIVIAIAGDSRPALLIFLAAVFFVLLIACSNIASLVLARMHARAREFSLRTALGASRGRLVRQLSIESLCLAGAGGALGLLAAALTIRLLVHFPPTNIPRLEETMIDFRVMLFALGASLAAVFLCGIFPAWSVSRRDVNEVLRGSSSRSVKGALGSLHRVLMVGQVALTFVLLVASGLLIRSFLNVQRIKKGYSLVSTVSTTMRLDDRYNKPERQIAFIKDLLARLKAVPGVDAAAAASHLPLAGGQSLSIIEVEGFPVDQKLAFESRAVTPDYFRAYNISILEGRGFTDDDVASRQPVIVVSRSFAQKYWPGQSALGKRVTTGNRTVVGVVGDVRQLSLEIDPPMQFYVPMWQTEENSIVNLMARSNLPPVRLASELRGFVHNLDPAVALADLLTGEQLVAGATAERRFETYLLTAFGGLALFLSLVGLYALMTYSVEQRTAEIGIRMALGAQPGSVMGLVLRQGSRLALAGILLGVISAWLATRALASLLFEVKPADPATFSAAAGLFCAVALAACYIPAGRATRVDPVVSLRAE
jgi:predicted permease